MGLHLTARSSRKADELITTEESMEELAALASTAGARVAERVMQSRPRADSATLAAC